MMNCRKQIRNTGGLGFGQKAVLIASISLALLFGGNAAIATPSSSNASFYKGKTLTIIVPTSPGGHFDRFARLIGHYLPKHLPVKNVKVVNRPGGGMLTAANFVYRTKPDGLTIGIANAAGYVFSQLSRDPGVQFNVAKFDWIGRPDNDPVVLSAHKSGSYQSFDSLLKATGKNKTVKGLAVGRGGFAYNTEVIIFNSFHIPFHMIAAFKGSHQLVASYLSGNGDVIPLSASSTLEHLASKSRMLLLVSNHPVKQLPHVPTAIAEAKKHNLSGKNLAVLKTLINVLSLGRSVYAPPGVPRGRLAALRNAFKAAIKDPDARVQAKKSGLFLGYAPPSELKQKVHSALTTHRKELQKYLKEK